MFFERDYIMRMIQMMGDFFRRLTEMMNDMDRARAIDGECVRRCGMTMETARGLSAQSLCELLPKEPRFLMSELCYLASELAPMGDAEDLMYKSLALLITLHSDHELACARAPRLAEMKAKLMDRLTAPELSACARFFYEGESYADMEDAIYQAVDAAKADEIEEVLDKGLRLLSDATEATGEALALCGMTRDELTESIQALSAIQRLTTR